MGLAFGCTSRTRKGFTSLGRYCRTRIKPHNLLFNTKENTLLGLHAPKHHKTFRNDKYLPSYRDDVHVGSGLERARLEKIVLECGRQWLYGKKRTRTGPWYSD